MLVGFPLSHAPSHLRYYAQSHKIKRGYYLPQLLRQGLTYSQLKDTDTEAILALIWSPSGKRSVTYKVKHFLNWVESC